VVNVSEWILWHNLRLGGATRGMWRILDGKGGEWFVFMFRAPNVVALACVNYGKSWLGLVDQALIMYWCIHDLWGLANLVASMVTELYNTPPY
jgi:hypothetical protein